MEPVSLFYEKRAQILLKNLRARHFDACYCPDRASALAAALRADLCQIYTDVDGVYTADPRTVKGARKLEEITFDEMLELASLGAQVLQNRSVEMAKKYNINTDYYALDNYSYTHPLPWDFIDIKPGRDFLIQENKCLLDYSGV